MTLDGLRKKLKGRSERLWWSMRFLQMVADNEGSKKKEKEQAAACFVRLANADPAWALAAAADRGPESHQMMMVLAGPRLLTALKALKLRDPTEEALLRAQLLCSSAYWTRGDKVRLRLLRKAWKELSQVPRRDRGERWKGIAQEPASEVDYAAYLRLANEALAGLQRDFDRSMALPPMIATASKHRDWPTFEKWVADFRSLPEALTRDHSAVAISNYEGLRALDENRPGDAETAMRQILEQAPLTPFLSNPDTSALPKRLRKEGRNLDLCDAFDQLVKERDWRMLPN